MKTCPRGHPKWHRNVILINGYPVGCKLCRRIDYENGKWIPKWVGRQQAKWQAAADLRRAAPEKIKGRRRPKSASDPD